MKITDQCKQCIQDGGDCCLEMYEALKAIMEYDNGLVEATINCSHTIESALAALTKATGGE